MSDWILAGIIYLLGFWFAFGYQMRVGGPPFQTVACTALWPLWLPYQLGQLAFVVVCRYHILEKRMAHAVAAPPPEQRD